MPDPHQDFAERIGLSPISGTVTRMMNGVPVGHKRIKPFKGLVELGFVTAIELDIDGLIEHAFEITKAGRADLARYLRANGPLPSLRSREKSINKRYLDN